MSMPWCAVQRVYELYVHKKKKNDIYIYIPSTNPFAHPSHPSCLYYYLLSPIYCFCTFTCFCTSYLSCTSCFALFFIPLHFLFFISLFYLYICSCVVLLLYKFYSLHCPLSGPDLIYISLLIIPCIIYYVTNKETLTLTLRLQCLQI